MRKKRFRIYSLLITMILLAGCTKGGKIERGSTYIYYVNTAGTGLEKEEYELSGDSVETQIEDVLNAMREEPDSIEYKSAFPKGVSVKEWKIEDTTVCVDFNEKYAEMSTAAELLLRAATVQSLAQINGVDYVEFQVNGKPLKGQDGKEIGYMSPDSFVQNTGSSLHSYQMGNLKLYFANKKGDRLVEKEITVRYNSNMSIEKLIVEELMKGPLTDKAGPTVPSEAKLLGVSVKDNICYVNFDEGFLNTTYPVEPKITIYSIVNSIVEGGGASQVQILVNGETDVKYQGSISLSKPFSRDLDMIEEKERE